MSDASTAVAVIEPRSAEVRVIDAKTAFLPVPWEMIEEAAELIQTAPGMAPEFKEIENCRFVAYQAARWGTDPVMTAMKTYFTPGKNGRKLNVGYEAQLIHALIQGDPSLVGPLEIEFDYSNPSAKTVG